MQQKSELPEGWPLPPLSEQHRIVSAIEALFARLDATNEKLDRVQEILKKFRESVLAAACDGRLTEEWRKENLHCNEYFAIDEDQFNLVKQWRIPTVWSWSTLEDSCSHVVDCPHSTPKWTDIGVYCVRTSELKCGHIDFSNAKYVSEATYLERIKRLKPQEGDILYSREGTVGIASLVPSNVKICLGQRLMLFRTKNNLIPSFFVKVLNSPYIYDSVKKSTMGSTAPRFNVADIKKFPTPLPPLPEQQEIVRRVDALFAFADSIETKVAAAREKTEKLRQSILAKAFSGQLVETQAEIVRREGRDYETAEVLIERIKEERKQ
ncbi:restriction endonuclease subunit S [Methanosarcina mazei]|nr:restriction endonuclease subunit S [Methanosarcina mazei]